MEKCLLSVFKVLLMFFFLLFLRKSRTISHDGRWQSAVNCIQNRNARLTVEMRVAALERKHPPTQNQCPTFELMKTKAFDSHDLI